MPFNFPILLTWLRVALIPLVVGIFYFSDFGFSIFQLGLASAIIFIVAAVTDWFDGFLARRWNQTSTFGAFLDPVADKLMVTGALLILVHLQRVDPIVAFIIIGREIAICALREWMAQIGASKSVAVSSISKIKTTAQMFAIPILLYYGKPIGINIPFLGGVLLLMAAVLTIWSMFYYLYRAWPLIKESASVKEKEAIKRAANFYKTE